MKQLTLASLLLPVVLLSSVALSRAGWVPDGTPLSVAASNQQDPMIVTDNAGGAIVVWRDYRSGTGDIYAQRVDASGIPQWTANGIGVCVEANSQNWPTIVSDGAGGAIIAWEDGRPYPFSDIYVQRVDAAGVPQWTANGVALCAFAYNQSDPTIVSDGAGGAIVAWRDFRSTTGSDIYAQRVDADGVPQWTADGVPVCTAPGNQFTTTPASIPCVVADGAGGAIVSWHDYRNDEDAADIYAQRVNAAGALQWTLDGVAVCTEPGEQNYPTIVSDDAGGAILSWWDSRSGDADVYAQRVNALGAPQWTSQGVLVHGGAYDQLVASMIPDGSGGAILVWGDRLGPLTLANNFDLYAQRLNASGTPQWSGDGVAVCVAANGQFNPKLASDGAGGAIVTWYDFRSGIKDDIYAQRMDASGTAQWTTDGVAVCTAVQHQFSPTIISDANGGAIITWYDHRSGNDDIYVQHLNESGSTITTGVPESASPALSVGQLYPNPFGATATLDITTATASRVEIAIYDVAGRSVRTLGVESSGAGLRSVVFDGRDANGRLLANGVYFARVRANGSTITRKMVIAR